MKALEFKATIDRDANLPVPSAIAAQIPKEVEVRVIVLLQTDDEDSDWVELTQRQFLEAYDGTDSIYDHV